MRRVSKVQPGSPAARYKIAAGDILLSINGEPVLDEIDYQALTAKRHLFICLRTKDSLYHEIELVKAIQTPLGLQFEDSLIGNPRTCTNNCIFCFVDQMPKGLRPSLYLKDDDWRMSLLMGNYITLTNVGSREFERIIRRKASPLFISVHVTDDQVREQILCNKKASLLMGRLRRLKAEGLSFHCQLVLCPGLNDGERLVQSLNDLIDLSPAALSVAIVPVGLTKHREGLPFIRSYSQQEARQVIAQCEDFQLQAIEQTGTRFAFPADEFYCIAGYPIPDSAAYEDFAQLENGIGMLRKFEDELREAHEENQCSAKPQSTAVRLLLPCGMALAPYLENWLRDYAPPGVHAQVVPIKNEFFGDTVTVSGLLVGQDLVNQLKSYPGEAVLVCETLLNSDNEFFLDDLTPDDLARALNKPVLIFPNNGAAFYRLLTQCLSEAVIASKEQV